MIIAIFFLFFVAIIIASNRNNYAKLTKHQKLFRFGLLLCFGGIAICFDILLKLDLMTHGIANFYAFADKPTLTIFAIMTIIGAVISIAAYRKL